MSLLTQLFCSHDSKVISEIEERWTVQVKEQVGGTLIGARTFWGEPILTTRKEKRVLMQCTKCGKIHKITL